LPPRASVGINPSLDDACGTSVAASNRSGSAPLLISVSPANSPPSTPVKSFRRPSCVDGVIPTSIIPKLRVTGSAAGTDPQSAGRAGTSPAAAITNIPSVIYEETDVPPPSSSPPQILATDFD